jgi:DNA-directed RNA polymerase subunit RPC12/RpoP
MEEYKCPLCGAELKYVEDSEGISSGLECQNKNICGYKFHENSIDIIHKRLQSLYGQIAFLKGQADAGTELLGPEKWVGIKRRDDILSQLNDMELRFQNLLKR